MVDTKQSNARTRALILSKALKRRNDIRIRTLIENFSGDLNYRKLGLKELAISGEAWACIQQLEVEPRMVFAHPDLLQQHPDASLYYRGIATLSLKRVSDMVTNVDSWENPKRNKLRIPKRNTVLGITRLYNAVISSIIEGTDKWSLENGYRNILATAFGFFMMSKQIRRFGQSVRRYEHLSHLVDHIDQTLVIFHRKFS